jgi:hypothetical protein
MRSVISPSESPEKLAGIAFVNPSTTNVPGSLTDCSRYSSALRPDTRLAALSPTPERPGPTIVMSPVEWQAEQTFALKTASPLATGSSASTAAGSAVGIVTRVGTGVTADLVLSSSLPLLHAASAKTKTNAETASRDVARESGDRRIDWYPVLMSDRSQIGAGIFELRYLRVCERGR